MANIKIKLGGLELDSEGPENFLKAEVPNFLKLVVETYSKIPGHLSGAQPPKGDGAANGHPPIAAGNQLSTRNLAAKLGASSGPELILAAAARLTRSGKEAFTRKELTAEMKTAASYYKASYLANMSASLNRLVRDEKLNEPSPDNFALTEASKAEIETKLCG